MVRGFIRGKMEDNTRGYFKKKKILIFYNSFFISDYIHDKKHGYGMFKKKLIIL